MQQLALKKYVSENSGGVLEDIAKQYRVSLKQVIEHLPNKQFVSAEHFLLIWNEVQKWGEVMFLLHLNDIILEVETVLPAGQLQNDDFHLQNSIGLGGHIKINHCSDIVFIERKFMTLDTASIVFLNASGHAMFKIFVGYDKEYQMIPQQLEQFQTLRKQLSTH